MRPGTRIALEASISAALAFLLSLIVFAPLLGSLDVAWAGGDMLSTYVNSASWGGFSYAETTQFGFPLGMDLDYFPGIDITENTFAWIVNGALGTTFMGINLLVILSFPLVAALAYLVIRMTGLQGPLAIALAVAFTFIPYHWGRALGHTYLSTLYSAVVGLALVLLVASGHYAHLWRRVIGLAARRPHRPGHGDVRRHRVDRRLLRRLHPHPRRLRAALALRPAGTVERARARCHPVRRHRRPRPHRLPSGVGHPPQRPAHGPSRRAHGERVVHERRLPRHGDPARTRELAAAHGLLQRGGAGRLRRRPLRGEHGHHQLRLLGDGPRPARLRRGPPAAVSPPGRLTGGRRIRGPRARSPT